MEYKAWAGEVKALTGNSGGFEGYASLFGVRDSGGDIVERGAFTEALDAFVRDGFIGDGHNWGSVSQGAIGTILDAKEDERGLFIKAEYHSTPAAQAARAIAQERLARGKSSGLSIGFAVPKDGAEDGADGRHLVKIKPLFEVSHVNVPMLRPAGMTSVKSGGMTLPEELDAVRAAVSAVTERVASLAELRASEGRKRGSRISRLTRLELEAVDEVLAPFEGARQRIRALLASETDDEDDEQSAMPAVADPMLSSLFARLEQFDRTYGHLRGPVTR